MKKLLIVILLCSVVQQSFSMPSVGPGTGSSGTNHYSSVNLDSDNENNTVATVAIIALFVGAVALGVAIQASENNPGQIRLAQF